mgnify:FL=1
MGMWNLLVDGFLRPGVKVAADAVGKVVQDAKVRADAYKAEREAKQVARHRLIIDYDAIDRDASASEEIEAIREFAIEVDRYLLTRNGKKQRAIRAEEQAILKADCARIREYAERFGWEGRSDDDEIIEKIEKIRETAVDMKDLAFINQIYSRACKRSLRGMDRCNSMSGRRYTRD